MRFHRARFFILLVLLLPLFSYADTTSDQRAALQAQLDQINKEIADNQSQLGVLQNERSSLERDVSILDAKIKVAQLEIKQRNLTIAQINAGIAQKQSGIEGLDSDVAKGEQSLAQILRETNEIDNTPLVVTMLQGTISDTFQTIDDFQTVQKSLADAFTKMASQRKDLADRKAALEDQQQEEQDLLQIQVLQQNSLKTTEKQKQDLVSAAKGQEAVYQKIIAGKKQTAAQIQSALFALNGANHTTSFGDMYSYAKEASAKTGVRPAFILAI